MTNSRIESDRRPFIFNAALSLELVFKAILARRGCPIPDNADGHNLVMLCNAAELQVTDDQRTMLELMTEELVWAARYPSPKKADRFDRFYDEIIEKHKKRISAGNTHMVLANSKTFPNFENYLKVWMAAFSTFEAGGSGAIPPSPRATS
ncbi:hypothetical protein V4R08_07745 [Nitrobacter sp. NHB1]|uniref:hypothetical protein n=1 Tax=Nitrobacter sp. NHB1 TaxID=3119830 RepID=UPI002FFDBA31